MLELSRVHFPGNCDLRFGGDALNTAIYLARAGISNRFITALGVDEFSAQLVSAWQREGVDTTWVLRHPRRMPGLYAISLLANGERSFDYWRDTSAARALFEIDGIDTILAEAAHADWLYVTGVTLSLFGTEDCARIYDLARQVRLGGGQVVFDPNFRPKRWPDAQTARRAFDEFAANATLALTGLEDERALRGFTSVEQCVAHYAGLGAAEIVVKNGANGNLIYSYGATIPIAPPPAVTAIDTTGAGDAFNAAYMAARMGGHPPIEAADFAHRIAAVVVLHPGAIVPRELTAQLFKGTERV